MSTAFPSTQPMGLNLAGAWHSQTEPLGAMTLIFGGLKHSDHILNHW